MNVQAISSASSFSDANAAVASQNANVKPGNLALAVGSASLSLTSPTSTATATQSAGSPGYTLNGITSGPPDAFQLSLTRIELQSVSQVQTNGVGGMVTPAAQVASMFQGPVSSTTCASGSAGTGSATASATATGSASAAGTSSGTSTSVAATPTTAGGVTSLLLYNNPSGAPLAVQSGVMDLGSLAGSCGSFPVATGPTTYNQVTVSFLRQAKISGCVTATFLNNSVGTATDTYTGVDGTQPIVTGSHTYCTRAGYSTFDVQSGLQNSDFDTSQSGPATGQLMSLDIANGAGGTAPNAGDYVSLSFPINPPITISQANQQVQISLVMDLNRMLRYYNDQANTQMAGGSPNGEAYFFTSNFQSTIYAFVGNPGHIYGYDVVYEGCDLTNKGPYVANTGPSDATCGGVTVANDNGQWATVGGWLTVITDGAGSPLVFNLMSDDDNALVILKGSANSAADGSIVGAFSGGTLANTVNVVYDKEYRYSGTATLQNFPADLGAAASGGTAPVVGTSINGVTFDATNGDHYQGPVYVQVGLSD